MAVCSFYDILRHEICCAITTLQRSIPLNGESPWLSLNKAKGLGLELHICKSFVKRLTADVHSTAVYRSQVVGLCSSGPTRYRITSRPESRQEEGQGD